MWRRPDLSAGRHSASVLRRRRQLAVAFMKDGQPVISVDAKKKELVGEYSNAGKEFQPKGKPQGPRCTTSSPP